MYLRLFDLRILINFPGQFGDKTIYGGFERHASRTSDDHKKHALMAKRQQNQAARDKIEKKSGSRYSELMRLPYFDFIRYTIIDPMHNLFEGTAKHLLKEVFINNGDLSKEKLRVIQSRINMSATPSEIGTIPLKFASCCSTLKAVELQNWPLYLSPFCLFDNIPLDSYDCWMDFVDEYVDTTANRL